MACQTTLELRYHLTLLRIHELVRTLRIHVATFWCHTAILLALLLRQLLELLIACLQRFDAVVHLWEGNERVQRTNFLLFARIHVLVLCFFQLVDVLLDEVLVGFRESDLFLASLAFIVVMIHVIELR